ncbi:MAG: diaminopimelate epimerase, partial [Chloroflexota bacterium]|nr:diaminopimelate epimerase [Chloroflexota bacterium]
ARYLLDRHGGEECDLETAGGIVHARRVGDGIGIEIAPPRVGGRVALGTEQGAIAVDVGAPHLVVFVEEPAEAPLAALARAARAAGGDANVEAAAVRGRALIDLRVDERGVGETLACGTGACATVAAAAASGLVDDLVAVRVPGGTLTVRVAGQRYELYGPAERVFVGEA